MNIIDTVTSQLTFQFISKVVFFDIYFMIVKIDVLLDVWWSQPMIGIVVYIVANYFEKIINYFLSTNIYKILLYTSSYMAIFFISYLTYNFASVDDILVCPLDNLETPSDIQWLTSPLKILELE